jgi:hypothetical protein
VTVATNGTLRTRISRAGATLLLPLLAGCGRQNLDLIVTADCREFETESACAEHSCHFQPNPEGCKSTDPSCPAGVCLADDGFVKVEGRNFVLNGEHFDFKGVSTWAVLQQGTCATVREDREPWLQEAFDGLVGSGAKVVRGYAFQNAAVPNGVDFAFFDSAIRFARRAGVRLQFALDHEQGQNECSEGPPRDTAWYSEGYKNRDGSYTQSYLDYATTVATRYANEPTVLGYVLVQSMNVQGNIDASALGTFVETVGARVRTSAPRQLLSLDLSWGKTPPASFKDIERLPAVDLINLDDYQRDAIPTPPEAGLRTTLDQLNKPAVVGETAFSTTGPDAAALLDRATRANLRVQEWHDFGAVSGLLFWAYQPGWTFSNDPGKPAEAFDSRDEDPLLQPGGVLDKMTW